MTASALAERGTPPASDEKPPKRLGRADDFSPPIALPRDPDDDLASPKAVRNVERLTIRQYCQGLGKFCFWATSRRIALDTKLTPKQIKYGFQLAECFGRILRLTYREFCRWMETVGEPVYGLSWPRGMRGEPSRVVIFVRLLPPPIRDPNKVWPLGFDDPDTPSEGAKIVPPSGPKLSLPVGQNCPSPSYRNIKNGTEEMEQRNVSFPLPFPKDERANDAYPGSDQPPEVSAAPPDRRNESPQLPTRLDGSSVPERSPASPRQIPIKEWEKALIERDATLSSHLASLCEDQRKSLLAKVKLANPGMGRFNEFFVTTLLIAELAKEHPGLYPEIVEPRKPPKPIVARQLSPLQQLEADLISAYMDKKTAELHKIAIRIATEFGDMSSERSYHKLFNQLVAGLIQPSEILDGYRAAIGPGVRRKAAIFFSYVNSRVRPDAHEKVALGANRQDFPESDQPYPQP